MHSVLYYTNACTQAEKYRSFVVSNEYGPGCVG